MSQPRWRHRALDCEMPRTRPGDPPDSTGLSCGRWRQSDGGRAPGRGVRNHADPAHARGDHARSAHRRQAREPRDGYDWEVRAAIFHPERGPSVTDPSKRDFATIEEAVEEIRAGRILVVVDDEDRENEGDLLMAADKVTPEAVNFMARHGRGLICMPMIGDRLDELQISMMVSDNTA